ncbi:transporter substrate-binding domain-containing protein [Ancylobacter defluvii]|uniref:Amino acid ABC substrate-binding protein n=1 Tax=Ancylobacter defluvii TaxID=1282440 RepID=A0A9W6JW26_9HYPH|nr:transporter substrate-binding domain-containing protein [Ancylobacter defluvii]MBS7590448.1 transporter substrate-binding domain-containing protein [Ancylobacter defluvii]GLK83369.1 amino acid ABC substrate-binding protein [Ancylobacter defluvii]
MSHDDWDHSPLPIGILFSHTGVTSAVERTQLSATRLAIAEINAAGGVAGRELVGIGGNCEADPKVFRREATRLVEEEGVRLLFGCYMSSTRKAVLPVVEARGALLFYPTLYEGFDYSPNCIYTGAVPNQNSQPLVRYLMQHYGPRMLLVGSNYIYPYESNRIFSDLVTAAGGRILDEIYVPLDPKPEDFERVLRKIARLEPDAVFSTIVGSGTAQFYEGYRRAGFDAGRRPIASLTTSEAEVAEMPAEAAQGHLTAAPYFQSLDTPRNRAFLAAWRQHVGLEVPVTAAAEAAYFQVHLAARAVAQARSTARDAVVEALGQVQFEAPQGLVAIDPANNHCFLWPKVAKLDARARFEVVWDPRRRITPDPYFASSTLDDWSLGAQPAGIG